MCLLSINLDIVLLSDNLDVVGCPLTWYALPEFKHLRQSALSLSLSFSLLSLSLSSTDVIKLGAMLDIQFPRKCYPSLLCCYGYLLVAMYKMVGSHYVKFGGLELARIQTWNWRKGLLLIAAIVPVGPSDWYVAMSSNNSNNDRRYWRLIVCAFFMP